MPAEVPRYQPRDADVTDLIRAAGSHPLGVDFLMRGHLGTVAITFDCHAFTVVAARDRLTNLPETKVPGRTSERERVNRAGGAGRAAD